MLVRFRLTHRAGGTLGHGSVVEGRVLCVDCPERPGYPRGENGISHSQQKARYRNDFNRRQSYKTVTSQFQRE